MSFCNPKPTLDNRHFLGLNLSDPDVRLYGTTGNHKLDSRIFELANDTPGVEFPSLLAAHLMTAARAGLSNLDPHDLEMINQSVKEMLESDIMFHPYKNFRKVAMFGSARIKPEEPSYQVAKEFAECLRDNGFMVITGAGPGIMQAGNEGAGEDHSFGLGIDLPFETDANPYVRDVQSRLYNYHYFFVRKLNFVKQADAFAAFPGGFGTMDEIFESLTLIQTGKAIIYPIVLLDGPGTSFWKNWEAFVEKEFMQSGLISASDASLYYITKNPRKAVEHIKKFYRVFHSYRFVSDRLVIRLLRQIPADFLKKINEDFADLVESGSIRSAKMLTAEMDEPFLRALPRLVFKHKIKDYGRLRQLIDRLNEAPEN